ncbi:hypothetical protein GCM10010278_76110 [Streptomyces melanogenes]|nr:hypothetical protein GCM10010278_76110 [Streptomyces melanogenes]
MYERDTAMDPRPPLPGALRWLADAAWQNVLLAGAASVALGVLVLA